MKDNIKFNKYFANWLYGKDAYYTSYKSIGKDGDFYTSVSTSSFFGGSIANNIIHSIKTKQLSKETSIVEIGAHHGYLLADIIQFIYTLEPKLLKTLHFVIVERFEELREKQEKYFQDSFGDTIKIDFYKDISEINLSSAYVIANEIFDAFACDLVYTKEDELQVAYINNHKIEFKKCEDKRIKEHCEKYHIKKGEVCLDYENFISYLYKNIKKFIFISFDYGDKFPRNDFSLRVYKEHKVYPFFQDELNLKDLYKNSDLTYDVHFKHLIDIFEEKKDIRSEFKTQMSALINFKILDLLELLKQKTDEQTYLRELQKVKVLIEPTGMGDRFKMLKIYKNIS